MLSRTSKITAAVALALTIGGVGLTLAALVDHVPGTPFGARLFIGLSMGIVGSVLLGAVALHTNSDREGVYRLGYYAGRSDAILDRNRRDNVTPIRRARSGAGHRARPSQPERGLDERADTHG